MLPENYRPISLLSTFSKIFEKLICNRIINFLNKCNLFNVNQHGFLKDKSVDTAIFEYMSAVYGALENDCLPLGLLLDFSRAYDCINHNILLYKLERYGIRNEALKWISSYLCNRRQFVHVNCNGTAITSEMRNVHRGIPQGSVIGPLLFNIFIIDLCKIFTNAVHTHVNYADDNSFIILSENSVTLQNELESVMEGVRKWSNANEQILNIKKTKTILFKTSRSNISLSSCIVENEELQFCDSVRFLGLMIDKNLNFNTHITLLAKKLNSTSYCIRTLKKYLDTNVLKIIYYGVFVANMKFAIIFWGSAIDIERILVIQKQVVRIIFDIPFRESCRSKFRAHRLLTVVGLYIYECLVFNFKYSNEFQLYRSNHNYGTRNRNDYNFPIHKLSMIEKGPSYASIKFFNKLPNRIKETNNLKVFKRELFGLLLQIEPYTVKEFLDFVH